MKKKERKKRTWKILIIRPTRVSQRGRENQKAHGAHIPCSNF